MGNKMAAHFGWQVSPYDGQVEFLAYRLNDITQAMADPNFPAVKGPAENLLDLPNMMVTIGWEEIYLLDNEVVNLGEDGFTSAYKSLNGYTAEGLAGHPPKGLKNSGDENALYGTEAAT